VPASGGTPRLVYDPFGFVGSMDVSPDGQTLVFREFRPVLYTLADGTRKELATQDSAYGIRFSPDGKKLVYQDFSTNAIRIRDLETDATTTLIDTDNYLSAADWFPDGNQLAVITDEGVELFTLKAGAQPERKLLKKGFALKDVDVSPDGKAIAYCINGQRSIFVMTGF
jgi:Tol biopolymer transport system component